MSRLVLRTASVDGWIRIPLWTASWRSAPQHFARRGNELWPIVSSASYTRRSRQMHQLRGTSIPRPAKFTDRQDHFTEFTLQRYAGISFATILLCQHLSSVEVVRRDGGTDRTASRYGTFHVG